MQFHYNHPIYEAVVRLLADELKVRAHFRGMRHVIEGQYRDVMIQCGFEEATSPLIKAVDEMAPSKSKMLLRPDSIDKTRCSVRVTREMVSDAYELVDEIRARRLQNT